MKNIHVRDIPDELSEKIVDLAREEGRSINKQIIHLLKKHGVMYKKKQLDITLKDLYDWVIDENREPAKTRFTAGAVRNLANEIEFAIYKAKNK